jgi:hypothetical protein
MVTPMRVVLLVLLLGLPALAAHPVAKPLKGPLEKWDTQRDSTGVVLTFAPTAKKESTQQLLDSLARGQGFQPGQLQAAFLKTPKVRAVALLVARPGFTIGKLFELAKDASKEDGVDAAWAFFHPGPTDEDIELEGYWRYEKGELTEEKRQNFRDVTEYMAWVRRRGSEQALARAEQTWPLAKLAEALGVPGRDAFVRPWGLMDWAQSGWPTDAGDDLVRLPVQIPDAMSMEIRQQAELSKASPSKLIHDALNAASTDGRLGEAPAADWLAPYDEGGKDAAKVRSKELVLYVDRDTYWTVQAAAESRSESFGKVVQYAWRRLHPFKH